MNLLLDTHTLLWFLNGDRQLSQNAKQLIENTDNICYVSVISFWEFTIKKSLGKLSTDLSAEKLFRNVQNNDYSILSIHINHLTELSNLKYHHRDPFDRLLIAQARYENLTVLSKDRNFSKYSVKLDW